MTETLDLLARIAGLVFLLTSMTGIGLRLSVTDLIVPFRDAGFLVSALVSNFVVAPVLALGVARWLGLDEPFAAGLLLLGLGAGAPFLPKIAGRAGLDPAPAIVLLMLLMAVTAVFLPLALPALIRGVRVEPWPLVRFLFLFLILPMIAGFGVRARRAPLAARLCPSLDRISTVALLLMVGLILAVYFDGVKQVFGTGAIAAAALFTGLASGAGWLLGGRDRERRRTLCLGAGLRNVPAALIVAVQQFPDPRVAVMVVMTTLIAIALLAPVAVRWGRPVAGPRPRSLDRFP